MTGINPYASTINDGPPPYEKAIYAEAKRLTYWPAVLMIAQGALITGLYIFAICAGILQRGVHSMPGPESVVYLIFLLPPLLVLCGLKLKRLESRKMSYVGAAISLFLFLPLGLFICIWAVVALKRPVVREAFKMRELTY
ncbi:hypothetical protein SH449x_002190 [Pirellulaceae bacterium SH449]